MKKLSLLFTVLFTTIIWAQAPEKMSYQAVIRNASEALVTNQTIGMQISILQGSTTGTTIYEEIQAPTSNANGLISLEIGTGTVVSGDFTTIDWSNDTYFIKTETDPTGGTNYSITGTSQLLSVPYALHAKTAENVSGLEKITESDGPGWRLIGKDPANYGNLGRKAVDFSSSPNASSTRGATAPHATAMGSKTTASGFNSMATGNDTTASGLASFSAGTSTEALGNSSIALGYGTNASGLVSTAMGTYTTASGDSSTATGIGTTASGDSSTAMGAYTVASGRHSTAMGNYTTAETFLQSTIGMYNTAVTGSLSTFVSTDRLFVIGNGSNPGAKSDALTILKNGTITAPSLDIAEITDNKSLITKEYFDANGSAATGLEQITEGGNTGWRLVGANPSHYGDIGENAVDLTRQELPETNGGASGARSIAMGNYTKAIGQESVAIGMHAATTGGRSTAIGYYTSALGTGSVAMGNRVSANSYKQTTLGTYNTYTTGDANAFVPTDRLFVIGNGTSGNNNRSDALVMLKNGNTTINGDLKVDEINATDSGNADMKAYAYGLVGSDGSSSTVNTDGYTLSYHGIGSYRITFDVPMSRTKYIAVATLHDGIGFINLIRQHNYIEVRTYNTSGNPLDRGFYFVMYKK